MNLDKLIHNKNTIVGYDGAIPPQAIPTKDKTEVHYQNTIDALELIGIRQFIDNSKYQDFYRMVEGKPSIKEVKDILPELRNIDLEEIDGAIPSYIRDYGLLGTCINVLVESYMLNRDSFYIKCIDPISTSERDRALTILTQQYLKKTFSEELNETLKSQGVEVDLSLVNFKDEEEETAYVNMLESMKEELTPESIKKYMSEDYRSLAAEWGEITMENDFTRFDEERLIRENMTDLLITGKCFRHFRIGKNYYEPENWSSLEAFYSYESNMRFPHRGEYIGRTFFQTLSQTINKYGDHLPNSLLKDIQDGLYGNNGTAKGIMPRKYTEKWDVPGKPELAPSSDYYDREYIKNLERHSGVPLTDIIMTSECGNLESYRGFASNYFGELPIQNDIYSHIRHKNRGNLRKDLIQITEGYFMDYQRVGLLCYENEFGTAILEEVTDEILGSMLKELKIRQISAKSRKEMEEKCEPNTITWFYKPYSRYFLKINFSGVNKDSYYYTEKVPFKITGNHENDILHPVAGFIGDGIAEKIDTYNAMHNLAMNQLQDLIEKEIGMFFLFDVAFLSNRSKDGKSNEAMNNAINIAKALGVLEIDTTNENFVQATSSGQFQPINMTLTHQIQSRMNVAAYYEQKALDLIGIKMGRNSGADAYKTTEGVRIDREAMYSQTEHYNVQGSTFLKEAYTIQLSAAQYCQINEGNEISASVSRNDGTTAFLKFSDANFPIRQLGVYFTTDAKGRKQLEQIRQYFLNNNTMVDDPLIQAKIVTGESTVALIEAARENRIRKEAQAEQAKTREIEITQAQAKSAQETAYFTWQLEEQSKKLDRESRERIAYAEALSRSLYQKSDTSNAEFVAQKLQADVKREKIEADSQYRSADLAIKKQVADNNSGIAAKSVELKERELNLKEKDIEARKYVATVNKN